MPHESRPRRLLLRAVSLGSGAALLGAAGCSSASTTNPPAGTVAEEGGHGRVAEDGGPQGITADAAGFGPLEGGVQGLFVNDAGGHGISTVDAGISVEDGGEMGKTIHDAGVVGTIVNPGG
jgi:hypothetical protein